MDPRRILSILLLLAACSSDTSASFKNNRGGPDVIRHARRINLNEYLVPPPPPRFHPGRSGRVTLPTEAPGYFAQLMNFLNPFSYGSPSPPPILPPPPLPDAPYPPSAKFVQPPLPPPPPTSGISAKIHGDSSLLVFDRPPLPPVFNSHPNYRAPKKCNACNKVPWVPMQSEPQSPPPQPPPQQLNGGYLPPSNPEVAHDAYHAASQEIGAPEFSFTLPSFASGFDGPPHLYPDAMPPLFEATNFHHSVQTTLQGNSEHLSASSSSGSGTLVGNGSFSGAAGHISNGEHNQQPTYQGSSGYSSSGVHQEVLQGVQGPLYIEPSVSNSGLQHLDTPNHAHGDLSSSGTQVSQDHTNSLLGLDNTVTLQDSFNPVNHQTSLDSSVALNHQTSGATDNGALYDITGPNGPLNDLFDNSNQIGRNPPESYGISGFERPSNRYEQRYNDLSSSSGSNKNSHGPPQTPSSGSSAKISDPIHFEESPLLDLTKKGESQTDSSPISPISNTLAASHENAGVIGTTLATHQGLAPTRSHLLLAGHLRTLESAGTFEKSQINNVMEKSSNGSLHDSTALQDQKVPYISSPDKSQVGYLWKEVSSTTLRSTKDESFLNTLLNFYDDEEEKSSQDISINSQDTEKQQGTKRNKQVQVIIPYTSQYTPLPFHPPREQNHRRKSFTGDHDNYISEESKNKIRVTSLPEPSNTFQTWPTTLAKLEEVTDKPTSVKANNSINVHRLQKNIDNWTIQEYSKGTTASTVSPSSVNPYLFPSKQIPDEYLTTTEPIDHTDNPHIDNVKTFTLAGFSFNDLDHESSASDHVEVPRVQVTQNEISKSTASTTETTVASTKDDVTWQGFYVDISPMNKERVYVVTPQPITTTSSSKSNLVEQKREKVTQSSTKSLKTDSKRTEKKMSTFESIEKAYQVLPQAVNNLAVASTGPDSVPLWGIMEHEEFASFDGSQHHFDNNENDDDDNDDESEIPVLYAGHSKVARSRR